MAYQYEAGFIGAGNMGGLLYGGALRKGGGIHRLRCGDGRSDPAGEPIRVLWSEAPDVCRCDGKAGGGHCGV